MHVDNNAVIVSLSTALWENVRSKLRSVLLAHAQKLDQHDAVIAALEKRIAAQERRP
jgi:hypothetical protein